MIRIVKSLLLNELFCIATTHNSMNLHTSVHASLEHAAVHVSIYHTELRASSEYITIRAILEHTATCTSLERRAIIHASLKRITIIHATLEHTASNALARVSRRSSAQTMWIMSFTHFSCLFD